MSNDDFTNLAYLKLLSSIEGIGPQKIFSLLSKFNTFQNIFERSVHTLNGVGGINSTLSHRISSSKIKLEDCKKEIEEELKQLDRFNARLINYWDEDYPKLLKKIYYPPLIIYTKGKFKEYNDNTIAIVGTRHPTLYGKIQAEKIATELAQKNMIVVSGMARGIDSIAHQTALNVGGKTIAVIGSGLDVVYPPENKKLYHDIIDNGLIISEYPLKTKPDAQNFPKRNRIISGLSLGTLIVETKIDGGAMQTARYAWDQNRDIFAIPGNINSKQSEGPNSLIQNNQAKLVTTSDDILNEIKLDYKNNQKTISAKKHTDLNIFEEKLLDIIQEHPFHIDDLSVKTNMSISDCLVNLLTLEFKGLIKQLPGKMFIKS